MGRRAHRAAITRRAVQRQPARGAREVARQDRISQRALGPSDSENARLLRAARRQQARSLADAYALVADAVARGRQITPAAEWFLDNYHLIEEQIRIARHHLPPKYSAALPRLDNETRSLRVYDLVLELISHSHGRVDVDVLRAFVRSYQSIQPLLVGELWAIPIMLRLALLENLRRVIAAVTAGRRDRESAARWADALLEGAAGDPSDAVRVLAQLVDAAPPMTTPFIAELASRLQGQGAPSTLPMAWLAPQRLEEQGQTIEQACSSSAEPEPGGGSGRGRQQHHQLAHARRDRLARVRRELERRRERAAR